MGLCSFGIESRIQLALIAGVDEAGRGCLAGPVVAAAVVFSEQKRHQAFDKMMGLIQDSKLLSAAQRESLKSYIEETAQAYGIASIDAHEVDAINILQATFKAAKLALGVVEEKLQRKLDYVLMDGHLSIPGLSRSQEPIIKGDQFSKSIAAASILAKVTRDHFMVSQAEKFPQFGFERHKGYGTEAHRKAIEKFGICELHRKSFLKKITAKQRGAEGEDLVANYLEKNRFKIIERNWKCKIGEIDLVAEKGGEIHFIEVRSRKSFAEAALIFPFKKETKLKALCDAYLLAKPKFREKPLHLDLIAVQGAEIEPHWDVLA